MALGNFLKQRNIAGDQIGLRDEADAEATGLGQCFENGTCDAEAAFGGLIRVRCGADSDGFPHRQLAQFRAEGAVRVFGVTLEKPRTGVVYDSIGLNGASVSMLALLFNEKHWAEELRHRNPDLVILNYGTNESGFAAFLTSEYEKQLREAIRRVRAALPDTSILVMSPMDRGQKDGDEIESWIFGDPPGKMTFVKFSEGKVVEVKDSYANIGGTTAPPLPSAR